MTAPRHLRMTAEDFAGIARCRPSPTALRVLRDGQVSRRLLLLKSVAGSWAAVGAAAWELCSLARRGDVRAAEEVLLHPHVGVWLGRCLRALDRKDSGAGLDDTDLVRLSGLAAAMALRAGLRPRLTLPAPGSLVWLPTLGNVRLSAGLDRARLDGDVLEAGGRELHVLAGDTAASDDERLAADGPVRHAPRELTARPHTVAPPLSVVLEDTDPYRDAHGHPVLPRLTAGQLAAWQASVGSAWDVVTRLVPQSAPACAELWTALVPLRTPRTGLGLSSSAREAYGAIAASFTADPVRLAETVVHETAHLAHGALADLADLTDPQDRTRHRVGWRTDARPIGSVLTGTHAHLALLEFWRRAQQEFDGPEATAAGARLRHYGRQVTAALRLLEAHRGLTPLGARFVAAMADEAASNGFPVRPAPAVHAHAHDNSPVRVASREVPRRSRPLGAASTTAAQGVPGPSRGPAGCVGTTADETTPPGAG